MDTIISAIIGELATRSLSLLIDRYVKPAQPKGSVQRLQSMLLRVRLTVEEAEGRSITNQAMLQQLNILRKVMYKGYYMLDTFIQQASEEAKAIEDHGVSNSLSLFKFSSTKRLCFSGRKYGAENLDQMLESLETSIAGMSELIIFLRNYPPMFRKPYSTYMLVEKCMFGRQMEMEQVINFLLHEEPPSRSNFGVLPIVGPGKVGKTTLVEHVCRDERVHDHFSRITFLSDNDLRDKKQYRFRDENRINHQHGGSNEEKLLVVIEITGIVDESAWEKLYFVAQSSIPRGSKVIIISRSEDIKKFGTTQALNLKFLSREAYWYFFKALVFGSTDPEEQPKLASIAMAIFDEYFDQDVYKAFAGPFIYLNKAAIGLKSNFSVQNWNKILECFRENRLQNDPASSKIPKDFRINSDDVFLRRVADSTQYCVVYNHDRIGLVTEEAPNITLHDILDGTEGIRPHGKFDILVWESHLPPYHKYIYSCQILEFDCKVTRIKQGQKRKIWS